MPGIGGWEAAYRIPIYKRKIYIHSFIQQKEKENAQMEAEQRKARSKKH
jgi:hypothetical protein